MSAIVTLHPVGNIDHRTFLIRQLQQHTAHSSLEDVHFHHVARSARGPQQSGPSF